MQGTYQAKRFSCNCLKMILLNFCSQLSNNFLTFFQDLIRYFSAIQSPLPLAFDNSIKFPLYWINTFQDLIEQICYHPQDIEILGSFPARSVLPYQHNVAFWPWLATLLGIMNNVTRKMPYRVDVFTTSTSHTSNLFLLGCLKLKLDHQIS